ncbi:MAG: hypothetical protein ACR2PA_06770 [Hyphomicrobiaceae bacterium]
MRALTLFITFLSLQLIWMTTANAQFHCGPRKIITEQLKDKFQESSGGMGLSKGVLFEIWSAPQTGTFTILTTTPQNISCIMAAGKDWSFQSLENEPEQYNH